MVARNKIVIGGTLGSTDVARWSVGINYGAGPGGDLVTTAADLRAWAVDLGGSIALGAYLGPRMLSNLTAEGTVRDVTCYYYDASSPTAVAVGQATTVKVGTGSVRMPAQVSAVASLRTGLSGRSYRGRFYWPAIGETMADTLSFVAGAAPALCEEFRDFIVDIGATGPNGTLIPVVHSATLDLLTAVSEVAVGSIPDTQRRRRDNLVEAYSVAAV